VTAAKEQHYDTDLLEVMATRVVVGDGAMGTQLQAADLSLDDFNNRRLCGRDEIRSAAIWFTLVIGTLPSGSGRVEVGVQTSGDDVDFAGREALQRFRVPAGIRHARRSQGRLPLRKERA
jgi:hypothetical protein